MDIIVTKRYLGTLNPPLRYTVVFTILPGLHCYQFHGATMFTVQCTESGIVNEQ